MNRLAASLLALGIAGHVMLGPWAARWPLALAWVGAAAVIVHARRGSRCAGDRAARHAALALVVGFGGLAVVTGARAAGWSPAALLALLYGIAATGCVTAFVVERNA